MHSKRCKISEEEFSIFDFLFIYIYISFVGYNCRTIDMHKYSQFRCIFHKCLLHLSKIDIQPFSSIFLNVEYIYEYIYIQTDTEKERHTNSTI